LESKRILSPQQADFRQHRATEDQITYIAQEIEDAYQRREHTLAVWVGLEKAFDKVWKEGLKLKLQRSQVCVRMLKWRSNYLTNISGRVQVQENLSKKCILEQGVPQGGVLSPALFLIYINDIAEKISLKVHYSKFADDLAVWTSEQLLSTAETSSHPRPVGTRSLTPNFSVYAASAKTMWISPVRPSSCWTSFGIGYILNRFLDRLFSELPLSRTPTLFIRPLSLPLPIGRSWSCPIILTTLRPSDSQPPPTYSSL
jgi:hypothetical protein